MENSNQKNSLSNFWKTPSTSVSLDDGRNGTSRGNWVVSMPPQETKSKPAFYQWGEATLFAPISSFNSKYRDISDSIRLDSTSCTVSLPFNIDQAVRNLLTEQYINQETGHSIVWLSRQLYYILKPLLPRNLQVRVRRRAVQRMSRRRFPDWELDTSVDHIHRKIMAKLLETDPGSSLPMISFWPYGKDVCLVLTHDVETEAGIENIQNIINIEQKHGFRSVWNFVPEKYPFDLYILRELQASGFEIGVHGLSHDGRLFESYNLFRKRSAKINEYLRQWGSVGFRSESNLRNLEWISKHIQVEYDTSCLSTEWYGAQPGGSCTVFPFLYGDLVELPITLQQDFTLLEILKLTPEESLHHWIKTVKSINKLNGLVLINVHPDYMVSIARLKLYEQFLEFIKSEINCWNPIPKEAARWWIDRNNSELAISGDSWIIDGPVNDRGVVMHVSLKDDGLFIQHHS